MASARPSLTSTSVIAQRGTVEKTATGIWGHRVRRTHAGTVEPAKKTELATTNVSAQMSSPEHSARRLSRHIHCARRIRASITGRVVFHRTVNSTSVTAWMASPAADARQISMIANHSRAKIMAIVSTKSADFRATVVKLGTPAISVRETSTNVPATLVRTTESASITTDRTLANAVPASAVTTANK